MKEDRYKTKEQLIYEIQELRKRLTDLKESDTQSQPVKETSFILEEALQESEERYRVLTEKTMAGIYLVQDGKFRYVNPAFEQIHGYTSDEIINKIGPTDLAIPEDRDFLKEKIRQRISGEIETDYFQLRIKRKDGTIRYLEVYGSRANFKGRPSVLGTCIDITARKEAEEALLVIRKAVESTSDAIGMSDLQGHHFYHNKSFTNLFEYTAEELEAAGGGQVAFSSSDTAREVFDAILNGRSWSGETEMISKSGHRFPVLLRADAIKDDVGRIISVLGTFTDITERKQAEKQLHYEKERFFTISENAPFGMIMIDKDGNFIYVNSKFKEIFGYDLNDIPDGRTWFHKAYPDPEYRHTVVSTWVDQLKEKKAGEKRPREFIVTCKDGTKKIIGFIAVQLKTGENIISCEDITFRKQAEEALQQSEEKHRVLIDTTDTGYLILDAQGRVIDANKEYIRLTGYGTLEEILGRGVVEWTAPYDLERNAAEVKRCVEQGYVRNLEIDYVNRSGQITPIELNATVLGSGDSAKIVSLCRDITERRRTEQKLKESEERYRNIFEHAVEGIFQSTPEGKFLSVNFAMAKMSGYTSLEEMVSSITDIGTQYYVDPKRRMEFRHLLGTQDIVEGFEIEVYRKDGSKIWVSENVRAVRDKEGKLLYYEGTIEDITERKKAEERIVTEKQKFLSLVDNAPFGMIMIDQDGNFQYFNSKFEEWFGYTLNDTPNGKTWFKQVCPDPSYRHSVISTWKADVEKLKAGEQIKNAFEVTCKDGSIKIVDFIPVQMESGQFLVACNDITSRIKAEKALTQSMDKLRKAIGGTIDVITMAVEARDPYTSGHQRRVSSLARSIAKKMDLSQEVTDGIRMAGAIHDLGKISIPAEILSMPRKLTELEFGLVKAHPQIGYDILKDIEFPYPIAQIVLQHHERLDGSGYPQGLKNVDIILEAKILAVADVVEAIASHRPYRPAKGIDVALEEIEKDAGVLYDREVVEACLKLFREKGFKLE